MALCICIRSVYRFSFKYHMFEEVGVKMCTAYKTQKVGIYFYLKDSYFFYEGFYVYIMIILVKRAWVMLYIKTL